jgi:Uroporphyrinogen decarboxylase (URO-D)
MTQFTKDRFHAICKGERPGDFGILGNGFNFFWPETLTAWVLQGAPPSFTDPGQDHRLRSDVDDFFQFDESRPLAEIKSGQDACSWMTEYVPGVTAFDYSFLACPPFEPRVLEEDEKSLVVSNSAGMTERLLKGKAFNMPTWLEYPVRDRRSWESFKRRLDPSSAERYPTDWEGYVREITALDCPISMEIGGFFGYINMWVGTENLMYMLYDDPLLVEDMMDTVLELESEIVRRVTRDISLDYVWYWEDMAYKGGAMISPDMVRKFMLPRYKKLNEIVRSSGCDVIYLDSDGDINQLIPLWLDVGINFFWPLECAAGMDPFALRKKYGRNVILGGGIDKREMMKDKATLKREVASKVPRLAETGPYFPSLDHCVPVDMPFDNFCYYVSLLREIRGDEALDIRS